MRVRSDRLYSDGTYLKQNPTWHAERGEWKAMQVAIGLSAANVKPQSVCDIGCGTGSALLALSNLVPGIRRAVGFEPSPDAPFVSIEPGVIDLRRQRAELATETFDAAMMLDVFEHVEEHYTFLRSVRRLAPIFAFHIPLDVSVKSVLQSGLISSRWSVGHLHYFTRETALQLLDDTGYDVVHWHYTASSWQGPGRKPNSPINLVRRPLFRVAPNAAQRLLGGMSLLVIARTHMDVSDE